MAEDNDRQQDQEHKGQDNVEVRNQVDPDQGGTDDKGTVAEHRAPREQGNNKPLQSLSAREGKGHQISIVVYNSVSIPYPTITQFRQDAVYDDLSGTDRCYTRIETVVQGVINAKYLDTIAGNLTSSTGGSVTRQVTDDAAEIMKAVRQRLLQPRRKWSMTFNGVELIPRNSGLSGNVDARNGPQPQSCTISQLTNVTFLVTWHCIGHFWENPNKDADGNIIVPSTNGPGSDVLFNRWTEIADFDNTQLTTYTRQGKYVIRSDNPDGKIADELRIAMAVIAPYDGFTRESSQYRVSPDGLGLEYRVVDRERFKMPPPPAFDADGEYMEIANTPDLSWRTGTVRVHLRGDLVTPQADLLNLAVKIAVTKMALVLQQPINTPVAKLGIPQNATARLNMYENEVEVTLTCSFETNPARTKGLNCFYGLNTSTPFSDGVVTPPNYLPYGTAGILLHSARYYDPNLRDLQLNTDGQLNQGLEPGQAGVTPEN